MHSYSYVGIFNVLHHDYTHNAAFNALERFNVRRQVIGYDSFDILVKAEAYREYEDTVPSAVDYAFGNVSTYPNNMKKWFIEDTITSAYGRCIGLLTPSLEHNSRPTVQDMQKVETLPADSDPWSTKASIEDMATMASSILEIGKSLGGELVAEAPRCPHGTMIWAEGTAKSTGKPWAAYKCTERVRANQCNPVWQVLGSDGKWKPQV